MTIRIALLGAGAMGSIMARDVYPGLRDRVEVAAVVDSDLGRAAHLARRLGAAHHATLTEAIDAAHLDGVDIRLPHAAHADAAVTALDRGLHVLVEKPLAISLADCARVAAAAQRAGRVVAVAENYPHLEAVRAARAAIEAGDIGEVLAIRSCRAYTLDGAWARSTWRQGSDPMSGLLWDQGTHHTSMVRALAGEVVAVSARSAAAPRTEGAQVHLVDLRLESGLVAQSLYCWGTPGRVVDVEGAVLGSRGAVDIRVAYETADGGADLVRDGTTRAISPAECYYDSHVGIVTDWLDAILHGRPPAVPVASATGDVAVVVAAHLSEARGGAEVRIEEVR